MCLNMRIFHGRPNIKQTMADWGEDGPVLIDISSVHYIYGNLLLHFCYQEEIETANRKVNWELTKPYTYGRSNPEILVGFECPHEYREFVKIVDETKRTMFYSDFKIGAYPKSMNLKLRMNDVLIEKLPNISPEIIIEGIEELSFRYGYYEIIFFNEKLAVVAQQLTGWKEGVAPFRSLEVPTDRLGQIIIPGTKLGVNESVPFYSFNLSL